MRIIQYRTWKVLPCLSPSVPSPGKKKPIQWCLERGGPSGYACRHDAVLCGRGQICFLSKLIWAGDIITSVTSQPGQTHTIAHTVVQVGAKIWAFEGSWFIPTTSAQISAFVQLGGVQGSCYPGSQVSETDFLAQTKWVTIWWESLLQVPKLPALKTQQILTGCTQWPR